MATVLILSKSGDAVPLGLRLASEGHVVRFWFLDDKAGASLQGYRNPSRVSDYHKIIDAVDLVLADMAGMGTQCDELAAAGKLVLAGGSFADKAELDREYGERIAASLTKAKLPAPASFSNEKELYDYVSQQHAPQVVKPLGNKKVQLTTVSADEKNRTLLSIIKLHGKDLCPCIVQECIEGIEISTEGWFNGHSWVKPFNHTMEKKRFLEGDHGPNTGCMGNVVWTTPSDRLTQTVLEPLAPLLKKVGYAGPMDVNCICTRTDANFLELTPRLGYDAIQALCELLEGSLFDFLYSIATQSCDRIPTHSGFSIAVRLSVSPYPAHDDIEKWKGVQVIDVPKEATKHVWLSDVMRNDEGVEVLAGVDGVIGAVTARGETVRECRRRAYRTVDNIVIHKDVQYRKDIGEGVDDQISQLKSWGWLNG